MTEQYKQFRWFDPSDVNGPLRRMVEVPDGIVHEVVPSCLSLTSRARLRICVVLNGT